MKSFEETFSKTSEDLCDDIFMNSFPEEEDSDYLPQNIESPNFKDIFQILSAKNNGFVSSDNISMFNKFIRNIKRSHKFDKSFVELKMAPLLVSKLDIPQLSVFRYIIKFIVVLTEYPEIPEYADLFFSAGILPKLFNILSTKPDSLSLEKIYGVFSCLSNLSAFGHDVVQELISLFGNNFDLLRYYIQSCAEDYSTLNKILILFFNIVNDDQLSSDQFQQLLSFFQDSYSDFIPSDENSLLLLFDEDPQRIIMFSKILASFSIYPNDKNHFLMMNNLSLNLFKSAIFIFQHCNNFIILNNLINAFKPLVKNYFDLISPIIPRIQEFFEKKTTSNLFYISLKIIPMILLYQHDIIPPEPIALECFKIIQESPSNVTFRKKCSLITVVAAAVECSTPEFQADMIQKGLFEEYADILETHESKISKIILSSLIDLSQIDGAKNAVEETDIIEIVSSFEDNPFIEIEELILSFLNCYSQNEER